MFNNDRLRFIFKNFTYFFFRGYYQFSFKKIGTGSQIYKRIDLFGAKYITIGKNFSCLGPLRLEAHNKGPNKSNFCPDLVIGNNVSLNFYCHIGCINKISIGNNVLIASHVFITDHYHGTVNSSENDIPPANRELYSKGPVIIENNVWIGQGVSIMPNVVIGENTVIGANAVVTKSFPANSVVAGNPAREIRKH